MQSTSHMQVTCSTCSCFLLCSLFWFQVIYYASRNFIVYHESDYYYDVIRSVVVKLKL